MTSIRRPGLRGDFNRFAGKEIDVVEITHATKYGPVTEARLAAVNPVVDELREAAADAGLTLRLWMPDTAGTCDYRTNRLNVRVEKDPDGKYRIGPRFEIG